MFLADTKQTFDRYRFHSLLATALGTLMPLFGLLLVSTVAVVCQDRESEIYTSVGDR